MSTTPPPAPAARSTVLRFLRVCLHVLFAFLLVVGALRTLVPGAGALHGLPATCTAGGVLLLAAVYLAGTTQEIRAAQGRARRPTRIVPWWLATVVLLWLALLLLSPAFAWLAFPLMFLSLHLLQRPLGLLGVILLWALCWGLPALGPRHQALSVGSVLGPGIGAVLAVLVWWTYQALYREAAYHQQVAESLRLAQEELAQREFQAGRFEERERLSREIHDTVAQGLSSILLLSRAAQGDPLPGKAAERLHVIETTAGENLAEARRFVRDLTAPSADSLEEQLGQLARRTEDRARAQDQELVCRVVVDGGPFSDLPQPVAQALLRAAQGSLANVVAHSGAHQAVVTLARWDGEVALDVRDDGCGFDQAALPARETEGHSGYGLPGLLRRAQALGGTVSVESWPGEGTAVAVRIPLTSRRTAGRPAEPDEPSEETR